MEKLTENFKFIYDLNETTEKSDKKFYHIYILPKNKGICIDENMLKTGINSIELTANNILIKPILLTNSENSQKNKNNFDLEKVRKMISLYQQLLIDMEGTIVQKREIKTLKKALEKWCKIERNLNDYSNNKYLFDKFYYKNFIKQYLDFIKKNPHQKITVEDVSMKQLQKTTRFGNTNCIFINYKPPSLTYQ